MSLTMATKLLLICICVCVRTEAKTRFYKNCDEKSILKITSQKVCEDPNLPNGCVLFDRTENVKYTYKTKGSNLPKVSTRFQKARCPDQAPTVFTLYTNDGPATGSQLSVVDLKAGKTKIRPREKTLFVTHGFISSTDTEWVQEIKNGLLALGDFNVITVDWRKGALGLPPLHMYYQALDDMRVTATLLANLIFELNQLSGIPLGSISLIGHSLGAHLCGMASGAVLAQIQRERNLPRETVGEIIGLDPAAPYFPSTFIEKKRKVETVKQFNTDFRLDKNDADFVVVIHSDAIATQESKTKIQIDAFGIDYEVGDVDFYPNGAPTATEAQHQPGCERDVTKQAFWDILKNAGRLADQISCNHKKAAAYFIESLKGKVFQNRGNRDVDRNCLMGYFVDPSCKNPPDGERLTPIVS